MSGFDPQAFLDATITEPNEKRALLPVDNPASPDGFYTAVVGTVEAKSGTIEKGERAGQPWLSMLVPLTIEVPQQLQDSLKLPPTLKLTDRAFIDLTPQGAMDNAPGKNRQQKAYREACDLNKPGDSFAWRMLQGRVLKLKIDHEPYLDTIQERISKVMRAN